MVIIAVKNRTGEVIKMSMKASATISDLKAKLIEDGNRIENLNFGGKQLENGRTLSEFVPLFEIVGGDGGEGGEGGAGSVGGGYDEVAMPEGYEEHLEEKRQSMIRHPGRYREPGHDSYLEEREDSQEGSVAEEAKVPEKDGADGGGDDDPDDGQDDEPADEQDDEPEDEQDDESEDEQDDMQILVQIPHLGKTITIDVNPTESIHSVKRLIHAKEGIPVRHQRLIFANETLYDGTIDDYYIQENDALMLVLNIAGGMAKKGGKRFVNKEVRLSTMRAKVLYLGSTLQQSAFAGLIHQVSQANYTESAIDQMSIDQLRALQLVVNDVLRVDKIARSVSSHMAPQLVQMKQQKDELDQAIKAIEDGFELGFAERYCTDTGFDAGPFYTFLQKRIEALLEHSIPQQMNAQMEAEVQRRLAAMNVPAPNEDDAM